MTELKNLQAKLQEEIRVRTGDIALGNPKDFSEYKHLTGIIRGLKLALDMLTETAERYQNDE
jgi:hypothetical protein